MSFSSPVLPPRSPSASVLWIVIALYAIGFFSFQAYEIRMVSFKEYGTTLQDFNPYFYARITEYLHTHGWRKFLTWHDKKSWYPTGRFIARTTHFGLPVLSCGLSNLLPSKYSLADLCYHLPAWLGILTTISTGYLGYLISSTFHLPHLRHVDLNVGMMTMGIMSILPAHLLRSSAGSYNPECLALLLWVLGLISWCKALSVASTNASSFLYSCLTGILFFSLATTWTEYEFFMNIVAVHSLLLLLRGSFTPKLYRAFSLCYVIGMILTMHVPAVEFTPWMNGDQTVPLLVFVIYQLSAFCEILVSFQNLTKGEAWLLRFQVFGLNWLFLFLGVVFLCPKGHLDDNWLLHFWEKCFTFKKGGEEGGDIRDTRLDPFLDSVNENLLLDWVVLERFLSVVFYAAPLGFVLSLMSLQNEDLGSGTTFSLLWVYVILSLFWGVLQMKLVFLISPVMSVLGGLLLGQVLVWSLGQFFDEFCQVEQFTVQGAASNSITVASTSSSSSVTASNTNPTSPDGKKATKKKPSKHNTVTNNNNNNNNDVNTPPEEATGENSFSIPDLLEDIVHHFHINKIISAVCLLGIVITSKVFYDDCWSMSKHLTHPTIIYKAHTQSGKSVYVDDYRQSYTWLKHNTPQDARIMAWWDYGYHITAMANRTTLADSGLVGGSPEPVALLGKIFMSSEKQGWEIAVHLADYILIYAGGGERGDDLAKSPYFARIANGVFPEMCLNDPLCWDFGMLEEETEHGADRVFVPTPMMETSLLYKLYANNIKPGIRVNPKFFEQVFTSRYGKVRIYKIHGVSRESKHFTATNHPACFHNRGPKVFSKRICRSSYPPALDHLFKPNSSRDSYYNYNEHDDTSNEQTPSSITTSKSTKLPKNGITVTTKIRTTVIKATSPSDNEVVWEDTDKSTFMWQLISGDKVSDLKNWIQSDPFAAFLRSSDGRGPMFWAYEYDRQEIIEVLLYSGVSMKDTDSEGKTPSDMNVVKS